MAHIIYLDHYSDLSDADRKQLLKFPAYISLLACLRESGMDSKEREVAVKLTHVKTFTSPPMLVDFYREAEQEFEDNIIRLNEVLPRNRNLREMAIHKELAKLEEILSKLGSHYALALHDSMRSYTRYISHAHQNVLEYFIFPMPIKGLSD